MSYCFRRQNDNKRLKKNLGKSIFYFMEKITGCFCKSVGKLNGSNRVYINPSLTYKWI